MTGVLEPPRRLQREDDRTTFASGAPELDTWIREFAFQNQKAHNSVTYVTVRDGVVLGYYALAMSAYSRDSAPEGLKKGRPQEIPCLLLARLAVDSRAKGRGVGAALLRDAIERSFQLSERVGAAALLIHCRDAEARSFYLANGDFGQSPVEPMHVLLSMKAIARLITSGHPGAAS